MLLRYWPPTGSEPSGGDRGNHVQRTTLTYYTRKMEVSWQIHDATYLEKRFQSYSSSMQTARFTFLPPFLSRFILIDSVSSTIVTIIIIRFTLHAFSFLNVISCYSFYSSILFSTRWTRNSFWINCNLN